MAAPARWFRWCGGTRGGRNPARRSGLDVRGSGNREGLVEGDIVVARPERTPRGRPGAADHASADPSSRHSGARAEPVIGAALCAGPVGANPESAKHGGLWIRVRSRRGAPRNDEERPSRRPFRGQSAASAASSSSDDDDTREPVRRSRRAISRMRVLLKRLRAGRFSNRCYSEVRSPARCSGHGIRRRLAGAADDRISALSGTLIGARP